MVEQLGNATFSAADIQTSFKAMQVSLNSTVAEGDNLGFVIAETAVSSAPGEGTTNLLPFCYLEYSTNATNGPTAPSGQVTFQQGAGQNSLRGLDANITPIQVRDGVGIKFFTTVV